MTVKDQPSRIRRYTFVCLARLETTFDVADLLVGVGGRGTKESVRPLLRKLPALAEHDGDVGVPDLRSRQHLGDHRR